MLYTNSRAMNVSLCTNDLLVVDDVEGVIMPSPLDDEIRGDWSNLKGAEYHLAYALWLLVCRNVESVSFYRGNDLLTNLIPPPVPEEIDSIVPAIHAQMMGEDEWIQLKATRE